MKAQVAVEFMLIFGVFLIGITIVVLATWNNIANAEKAALDFEAGRILNLISSRINTAYLEGNGFSIGLSIPEKIGLNNYTLQLENNIMWLNVTGASYSRKLLTSNISGTLSWGENTLENVNGMVVIS
jgi:hypothetical protein